MPPGDLYNAVALNSVSFNLARTVGPALGAGILLLTREEGTIFAVNAATYGVLALALLRIPRDLGAFRQEDRATGQPPAIRSIHDQADSSSKWNVTVHPSSAPDVTGTWKK